MAHLYRLIAVLGLVFLLSPHANAQATPVSPTYGPWGPNGDPATYCPAAHNAANIAQFGWSFYRVVYGYQPTYQTGRCESICNNAALCQGSTGTYGTTSGSAVQSRTYVCPANYAFNADDNLCYPNLNNCAQFTGSLAGDYNGLGGLGPKTICVQDGIATSSGDSLAPGCVLTGTADFAAGTPYRWVAVMTYTGAKCKPGDFENQGTDPLSDPEKTNCPPGKLPGTVNGTEVCVEAGRDDNTQKETQKENTTNNPDGSTTQTQQTQQTTCQGATCTTTTTTTVTTTPVGGGPGTSETTTSTGTCTRGSPGCGDEESDPSSFGGTCAAFACDGDAIMCAVALEQHKRNCQLFVNTSAESDLYESEKGKTGPQYTSEPTVNIGPGSISQSNVLAASAQCISDKTITVAGNTITLPFSQICSTLQHLGTVLLFIAFLTAYRIVSGR